MSAFQRIPVAQAVALLAQESAARLVDIRDPVSFSQAHVAGAYHLTNDTLAAFLTSVELDDPVLVLCYHGHSSQSVAQYLCSQGLSRVFSVDGGFVQWSLEQPASLANQQQEA